jgi:hypothetical protein
MSWVQITEAPIVEANRSVTGFERPHGWPFAFDVPANVSGAPRNAAAV